MAGSSGASVAAWHRLLLPFALPIVIGMAIFFAVASTIQFYQVMASIEPAPPAATAMAAIADFEKSGAIGDRAGHIRWKVDVLLREQAQQARAGRASSTLLVSLWTRNLGFMTGMVLAILGATFIMWRLGDEGSELTASGAGVNASLKTASPGIVLVALGTVLMGLAMSISYSEQGTEQIVVPAGTASPSSDGPAPDEAPVAAFPPAESEAAEPACDDPGRC